MTHLNDTMSTSLLTTHKKNAHLTKEERVMIATLKSQRLSIMNAAELKELIDTAKDKIDDYHQHSLGKINFWTTTPSYDNNYVICIENARNNSNAIVTRDILQLNADKFTHDDYLEIIDKLHELFPDIPFLFHELPRKKLNELRDKYGSYYIRDDIVISEN